MNSTSVAVYIGAVLPERRSGIVSLDEQLARSCGEADRFDACIKQQ